MIYFAKISYNNIVEEIIILDDSMKENGSEWLAEKNGGLWIETSYDNSFRGVYAQKGCIYNEEKDVFLPLKPYSTWIFDFENFKWKAPIEEPLDQQYQWDNNSISWAIKNNS
jgi:hypothetical protein